MDKIDKNLVNVTSVDNIVCMIDVDEEKQVCLTRIESIGKWVRFTNGGIEDEIQSDVVPFGDHTVFAIKTPTGYLVDKKEFFVGGEATQEQSTAKPLHPLLVEDEPLGAAVAGPYYDRKKLHSDLDYKTLPYKVLGPTRVVVHEAHCDTGQYVTVENLDFNPRLINLKKGNRKLGQYNMLLGVFAGEAHVVFGPMKSLANYKRITSFRVGKGANKGTTKLLLTRGTGHDALPWGVYTIHPKFLPQQTTPNEGDFEYWNKICDAHER